MNADTGSVHPDARSEDRFLGQQYSLYGEAGLLKAHPVQISASLPLSVGTLWFVRRDNGTRATGRATVPVLWIQSPDGCVRWLPESLDIIQYLEKNYS